MVRSFGVVHFVLIYLVFVHLEIVYLDFICLRFVHAKIAYSEFLRLAIHLINRSLYKYVERIGVCDATIVEDFDDIACSQNQKSRPSVCW